MQIQTIVWQNVRMSHDVLLHKYSHRMTHKVKNNEEWQNVKQWQSVKLAECQTATVYKSHRISDSYRMSNSDSLWKLLPVKATDC